MSTLSFETCIWNAWKWHLKLIFSNVETYDHLCTITWRSVVILSLILFHCDCKILNPDASLLKNQDETNWKLKTNVELNHQTKAPQLCWSGCDDRSELIWSVARDNLKSQICRTEGEHIIFGPPHTSVRHLHSPPGSRHTDCSLLASCWSHLSSYPQQPCLALSHNRTTLSHSPPLPPILQYHCQYSILTPWRAYATSHTTSRWVLIQSVGRIVGW